MYGVYCSMCVSVFVFPGLIQNVLEYDKKNDKRVLKSKYAPIQVTKICKKIKCKVLINRFS